MPEENSAVADIKCTGLDDFVNHRFSINKVLYVKQGEVKVLNESKI